MRDPRIICRTELLDTIHEEREALVDRAAAAAASINDADVDHQQVGIEVLCLLREVYATDRVRSEIAAMTKHSPSEAKVKDQGLSFTNGGDKERNLP